MKGFDSHDRGQLIPLGSRSSPRLAVFACICHVRPTRPRPMLDGQRTCVANQSIGGQIHAAIFSTKLPQSTAAPTARDQSQPPPPSRKPLQTIDHHHTKSLNQARFLPNAG